VRTGTIHAFCVEVLREFTGEAGLQRGFGIADEEYQRGVLLRLKQPVRFHTNLLKSFGLFRFCKTPMHPGTEHIYRDYLRFLQHRNLVDFDQLVMKVAELMETSPTTAQSLRSRWDFVLVDEFQDLNSAQYAVVKGLALDHQNIFCVGDDEQSIFSWTGADPKQFVTFMQDFDGGPPDFPPAARRIVLDENRRCPRSVMEYARRLVLQNQPLFAKDIRITRESPYPVQARAFPTDVEETDWLVADIRADHKASGLAWGDYGILYRKHEIGDLLEARMLTESVPCRLAHGRALSEDPVVQYVVAALRVIASPDDDVHRANFYRVVLPKALFKAIEAKAEERKTSVLVQLRAHARSLPKEHEDGRKIRRGSYAVRNLAALGKQHRSLVSLVEDLLSQRVGEFRTYLEDRHDVISGVTAHVAVVELARALREARDGFRAIWIPPLGGSEIALKNLLQAAGPYRAVIGDAPPPEALLLAPADGGELGLPLGLFKALQLNASEGFVDVFRDFTVVDLETTDRDTKTSEIVEIAAVRVRDGVPTESFTRLVKPRVAIAGGALRTHGITEQDVAGAPYFEEVWQEFRAFIGDDILVAHNGYQFDFPILRRMSASLPGGGSFTAYDTLPLAREITPGSRKLSDLAHAYGVAPGQSHRALDDCRALAQVFPLLNKAKIDRARKTGLPNLLDHLGIALWLQGEPEPGSETAHFKDWTRINAFFAYSEALELYSHVRNTAGVATAPTMDDVITILGGADLMQTLRAHKTADQRYPVAMARLRRLIEAAPVEELTTQIVGFLERVALSKWDGTEADANRVNLLTLHATKGLEFSRVYVVGVEDAELPGTLGSKALTELELEESRRLLYVGMTRTKDRLVLTRVALRRDKETGGQRFL
ncbi:MAG: UvrD-helicase domain-containing protein, partial [Gemmatimonadaceae bacterium]